MPPKMKRLAFHVWLTPADYTGEDPGMLDESELVYHHVAITNGDQLRAELEAGKLKLDQRSNPMHLTTLWLWAALVRMDAVDVKFQEFKHRCVSYDPDRDRDQPHTDPAAELDELDERPTVASSS